MSKILLLGSKQAGEKNDIAKLATAFTGYPEVDVQTVYWEDLMFEIGHNQQSVTDTVSGMELSSVDFVFAVNWYRTGKRSMYRDVAFAVALYLHEKGVRFWNQEMLLQRSTSKLSALMQLSLLGVDIPHTRFSLSASLLASANQAFPVIVKAANASRGRANYKIETQTDLSKQLEACDLPNRFLLQEYIPNQSDLRIVCVNSEPRLVIERRRQEGGYLNNVSQGATANLIDLTSIEPAILQACREICQDMGRDIAGIDLMHASDSSGRTVVLEVNAIPQLTSGAFVAEKLAATASGIIEALERKRI